MLFAPLFRVRTRAKSLYSVQSVRTRHIGAIKRHLFHALCIWNEHQITINGNKMWTMKTSNRQIGDYRLRFTHISNTQNERTENGGEKRKKMALLKDILWLNIEWRRWLNVWSAWIEWNRMQRRKKKHRIMIECRRKWTLWWRAWTDGKWKRKTWSEKLASIRFSFLPFFNSRPHSVNTIKRFSTEYSLIMACWPSATDHNGQHFSMKSFSLLHRGPTQIYF